MATVVKLNASRGGSRPGAGRIEGTKTIRSREFIEKWIKSGKTVPAQVMLEHMQWCYNRKLEAARKVLSDGRETNKFGKPTQAMKEFLLYGQMAFEAAEKAAKWVHPTLTSVTLQGDEDGGPIRFKRIERVIVDASADHGRGKTIEGTATEEAIPRRILTVPESGD